MAYPNNKKQYGGGRPGGKKPPEPLKLPDGYLNGGYFYRPQGSVRDVLKEEYILGYPAKIAEDLYQDAQAQKYKKDQNKSSQIRKFYDFCVRLRDKMSPEHPFCELKPVLLRLDAFAVKAHDRELVTNLFVDFIRRNLRAVENAEDFNAFVWHFEAVVAHMKQDKGR